MARNNLPITHGLLGLIVLLSSVSFGSLVESSCREKPRYPAAELKKLQEFQNKWEVLTSQFRSNQNLERWTPTMDQSRYIYGLVQIEAELFIKPLPVSWLCKNVYRRRREYRQMSYADRRNFHLALYLMMSTLVGGMSQYHIFVNYHHPAISPAAHGGAAFLPYHREYLFRFENALKAHVPAAYLPYWDSTLDRYLPNPAHSVLWNNELLGDNSGLVTTGTFANWPVVSGCGTTLTRNAGAFSSNLLFEDSDIDHVLSLNTFQQINTDTSPLKFERTHGGPHVWVGGHMSSLLCAPSDPLFWMHHAFVDCVWETFRKTSQTTPLSEYPNHTSSIHYPNAAMGSFTPLTNKHGVGTHYSRCYSCQNRPSCCSKDSDCGSYRYLFCHRGRCKSKVKIGGDCTGLPHRACYSGSSCINNKCIMREYPWLPWYMVHSLTYSP